MTYRIEWTKTEILRRNAFVKELLEDYTPRKIALQILFQVPNESLISLVSDRGLKYRITDSDGGANRQMLQLSNDPDNGFINFGLETIGPVILKMDHEQHYLKANGVEAYAEDLVFIPYPRFDDNGNFDPKKSTMLVVTESKFRGLRQKFQS